MIYISLREKGVFIDDKDVEEEAAFVMMNADLYGNVWKEYSTINIVEYLFRNSNNIVVTIGG